MSSVIKLYLLKMMINVIDIHCHQLVTKSNVSCKKRIKMQSMIKLPMGGSVNYVKYNGIQ